MPERQNMVGAEQLKIKDYLLGRLPEADMEEFELKLLSDPAFGEELDIIVDEITDDYVAGKFSAEDRKHAEEYFFKTLCFSKYF